MMKAGQEQQHLEQCREVIRHNISHYEKQTEVLREQTKTLFAEVSSGNTELYAQLTVAQQVQEHSENQLRKNRIALDKPYFGRIDYLETEEEVKEQLYIGKNGISKDKTEVVIVDWRAPVSTLYYENEIGPGEYEVPGVGTIAVDLQKKRTFDISDGRLLGYYDNDMAASDELLVKYLSQNKDAVLGDIISTIQKEQNRIIRRHAYRNTIVQGVAGSGKTTVAMHRISYILYNYEERFTPDVFCIIGSNDMLLNYITSGLPELDVRNVRQRRMDRFFIDCLEKEWKKTYQLRETDPANAFKSCLSFVKALDAYLNRIKMEALCGSEIRDSRIGTILSADNIRNTVSENPHLSVFQLCKLLNERIRSRIKFLMPDPDAKACKQMIKDYSGYFKQSTAQKDIVGIYLEFLRVYGEQTGTDSSLTQEYAARGRFDVYDTAALALIRKRITAGKIIDEFGQIFIDEAQDFGSMVYYVLKQILKGCYFTIMGDVSQNINYETGMNDWEDLRNEIFAGEHTDFQILAKSYRNTIEISEYAGRILEKASFGRYRIEPVIRHGAAVGLHRSPAARMVETAAGVIDRIRNKGFDTIAVICRNPKTAEWLKQELAAITTVDDGADFGKGVMVLPIMLTKGLEFDGVILWDPSEENYPAGEAEAKLLYVAVTRALHELHLVCNEDRRLSGVLAE